MSEKEFDDWVTIDENIPTSDQFTEDDLYSNKDLDNNITQDESDDDKFSVKIPTNKELLNALNTLRVGVFLN